MIIGITSYRGGLGKSLFSLNLVAKLVKTHKALLIEADFLAPTLVYIVPSLNPDLNWNDYLLKKIGSNQLIQRMVLEDKHLEIVCTRPNHPSLFEYIQDKNLWKGIFFEQINKFLSEQRKKRDFIIIDNQSGMFLSSATHAFFSDILICVSRPDTTDVPGTYDYLRMLKKKFYLVWNHLLTISNMDRIIEEWTQTTFGQLSTYQGCLGKIPFDEKTAYQRWIEGQAIIRNTNYTKEVENIANALIKMKEES